MSLSKIPLLNRVMLFFIFSFVIFSRTRNSSSYVIRRVEAYLHSFSEKKFFPKLSDFEKVSKFVNVHLGEKGRENLGFIFHLKYSFSPMVKSTYFPYSSPFKIEYFLYAISRNCKITTTKCENSRNFLPLRF